MALSSGSCDFQILSIFNFVNFTNNNRYSLQIYRKDKNTNPEDNKNYLKEKENETQRSPVNIFSLKLFLREKIK